MRRPWPIIAGLALLSVAVATVAFRQHSDHRDPVDKLTPVKASSDIMADGTVVPVRSVALSLTTGGVVSEMLVSEGDPVAEGQLLLRVGDARQQAAVAEAEAALARAEARMSELKSAPAPAELRSRRAALSAAVAGHDSAKAAGSALQGAEALARLEQARAELSALEAGPSVPTLNLARADISSARAALLQTRAALSETALRAPLAGTVGALYCKLGELAAPGVVVARVGDISSWAVETANLTEASIARVKERAPATLAFDAIPGLSIPARVTHVAQVGENRQGDITYAVVLKPLRTDARLRWNMTAQVSIKARER